MMQVWHSIPIDTIFGKNGEGGGETEWRGTKSLKRNLQMCKKILQWSTSVYALKISKILSYNTNVGW